MSDCTITIDDEILNTEVIIDDSTANLNAFYLLLNNINTISNNYTNLVSLTSKFIETAEEMDNFVQPLTAKWIETATEMDTLQEAPTGHWQGVYEYIQNGVIDAGYF